MVDDPPQVSIITPTDGQTFYKGASYNFEGHANDYNEPLLQLPCTSLKWTSSYRPDTVDSTFPQEGCQPVVTFASSGKRVITLTGTDSQGQKGTAQVTVNVVDPPPNSPPIVTILQPNNHTLIDTDEVTLLGTAFDPDHKSPISYEWVLEGGQVLGSEDGGLFNLTSIKWKPYDYIVGHCSPVDTRVYLYATDPDGSKGVGFVDVSIYFAPC